VAEAPMVPHALHINLAGTGLSQQAGPRTILANHHGANPTADGLVPVVSDN